jgi:hypothetical protein
MVDEQGNEKRIVWWRQILIVMVFVAIGGILFARGSFRTPDTTPGVASDASTAPTGALTKITAENTDAVVGRVAADTNEIDPSLLRSENFRLGDVAVGGDIVVTSDGDRYVPLSIVFVRGESVADANKKDSRILVSWKTSKSATSTIKYGKNTGENAKTIEEDGYGMNHSVVLPGLEQATTYLYTITVRDRWGNEITSDPYAVYTGAKNVSLFELIAGALGDTFGWAFKK